METFVCPVALDVLCRRRALKLATHGERVDRQPPEEVVPSRPRGKRKASLQRSIVCAPERRPALDALDACSMRSIRDSRSRGRRKGSGSSSSSNSNVGGGSQGTISAGQNHLSQASQKPIATALRATPMAANTPMVEMTAMRRFNIMYRSVEENRSSIVD